MPTADRTKWDARYQSSGDGPSGPEPLLQESVEILPRSGRALDLAGGPGRNGVWLAGRGLDVTVADISTVALDQAARLAAKRGVSIRPLEIDLEAAPFPAGPWELVLCARFFHRPTYRAIPAQLAAGGLAIVLHPTRINLERNPRPGPRHLLGPGELPGLLPGLEVLRSWEGWTPGGRHEAHLVGRGPG